MDVSVNFASTLQTFRSLNLKAIGLKLVPDGEPESGNRSSINVSSSNQLMDVLFLCCGVEETNFYFELFISRAQVFLIVPNIKRKPETGSINCLIVHLHQQVAIYLMCKDLFD